MINQARFLAANIVKGAMQSALDLGGSIQGHIQSAIDIQLDSRHSPSWVLEHRDDALVFVRALGFEC